MRLSLSLLLVITLAGCSTTRRGPALPYAIPSAPATGSAQPAKSSPVRIIFIRPEARDHVHP